MYQNNITTAQIKDKSYLQRFNITLLYPAKIKTALKYINMNITTCAHVLICIYNMLQKYNIDTIKVPFTVGLRQTERLRGLQQTERLSLRVLTDRTTSRVQPNRTISL